MKDRRVERERPRSEPRWGKRDTEDRLVEEKGGAADVHMECSFEVAHLAWVRCGEACEPVVLGQASEPMS